MNAEEHPQDSWSENVLILLGTDAEDTRASGCVETAVSTRIVAMNITAYPEGEESSTSK